MPRAIKSKPSPIEMENVRKSLCAGKGGIDSGLLLNAILTNWGTVEDFGRDIYTEYQAAKPGSLQRQKILELISRLTIVVTTQAIAKPRKAEDMSDDELMTNAGLLLERINHERSSSP